MRPIALLAALFAFVAPSQAQQTAEGWAGVYRFNHEIGMAHDDKPARVENILEVVPLGADKLYVRIDLWAHNAHRCKFYGVTNLGGNTLTYRGKEERYFIESQPNPAPPPATIDKYETGRCELSLTRRAVDGKEVIMLSDPGHRCHKRCGANAYFDEASWDVKSRRAIRYLDRLKASPEYQEAIAENQLPGAH